MRACQRRTISSSHCVVTWFEKEYDDAGGHENPISVTRRTCEPCAGMRVAAAAVGDDDVVRNNNCKSTGSLEGMLPSFENQSSSLKSGFGVSSMMSSCKSDFPTHGLLVVCHRGA